MRASARLLPLCLAAVIGLAACGRLTPGFIITSDGEMLANNGENQRLRTAAIIRGQLDEQLGGHWLSLVTVAEQPEYVEDERDQDSTWRWTKATVAIELVGDGGAPLPETTIAVHDDVYDYLRRRVDHPKVNLVITVADHVDAARFAALKHGGAQTTTPVAPTPSPTLPADTAAGRHYTLQKGDTLADLSTAFYGTPQHWRSILAANPGLDAEHLVPGTVVLIPPAP